MIPSPYLTSRPKTKTTTRIREYDEHDRLIKETVTEVEYDGSTDRCTGQWPTPYVTWGT